MLRHIIVERLAGNALHDVTGKRRSVIGIGRRFARREKHRPDMPFEKDFEALKRFGIGDDRVLQPFFKTGPVRHQLIERDGFAEGFGNPEIKVAIDVGVEVQLALFHQLHHRRPCDELGHRTRAHQRASRVHRHFARDIGIAIALGKQDLAVLHHRYDRARDIALFKRNGKHAVEPCFKVAGVEVMGWLRDIDRAPGVGLRYRGRGQDFRGLGDGRCPDHHVSGDAQ